MRCENECKIVGFNCINCGWEMKLLNLYIPSGKKEASDFREELMKFIPEDTQVITVEGHEICTLNEVGFSMDMHDKLRLTTLLVNGLADA